MSGLLVLGAGGHGKVVADVAQSLDRWAAIAFLDDRAATDERVLGLPVLGPLGLLAEYRRTHTDVVVAVGDARRRLDLLASAHSAGFALPILVHSRATVSPHATLGAGTVVMAGAVVNPEAQLGRGVIVNTGATVDHDCKLGDGVHVCPGVHLAGTVTVGARTWVGIGARIKQGVTVGADVMIGAGSTVLHDLPDGVTVIGTPARPLRRT